MTGTQYPLWVNTKGQRVAADCPDAHAETLIMWPLPLESWLPAAERRAARLPAASPTCPPLTSDAATPLLLTGVRDGGIIKRVPGQNRLPLRLTSQGGEGPRWWFLNGEVQSGHGDELTLEIDKADDYQVLVMDESGQTAVARFTVQ